jgi:nucleoside-diphosphate-sugar epimerase
VFYPCHREVLTNLSLVESVAAAMQRRVRLLRLPRTAAELARGVTSLAARVRGKATLLTRDKAHEFYAPAWVADPGPLETATGWQASHDIKAGFEATAAWYRAAGWL